jgi:hypothetical protein
MTFAWRAAAAMAILSTANTLSAQQYDYYSTPETTSAATSGYSLASDSVNRDASYSDVAGKSVIADATTLNSIAPTAGCGCATACDRCGCGNCCSNYCNCCCQPLWTVKAGIVYLDRVNPRPAVLVEDTVTGDALALAQNYNFNWNAGLDISAIRALGGSNSFELRYFGIDGWQATQDFTTSPIWNFPTDPPLFGLGVANIHSVYTSRLYSTEANLWHRSSDRLAWMLGFRWVQIHENLTFDADFGGNQAVIADNVDNNLYGGQIGLGWQVYNGGGRFRVDSVFKAGIFGNSADNTFGVTQAIGPAFGAGQSKGQVAFVGEIGLTGVYQWTDHIALRGGYQLLWVEGVALASDQLSAVDVLAANGIDTTGGTLYHGALASIDFTW